MISTKLCANVKEWLNNPGSLASIFFLLDARHMTRTDAGNFFDETTDGMNLR